MDILIKRVKLLDPEHGLNKQNDLLISEGIIKKIGDITPEDEKRSRVFEFENNICSPGFFDMHVHLREPGREDTETILTGSNSAAAGGFTEIACMPNTDPAIDSAEVVRSIKEKSAAHLVNVYPIGAVTVKREGEALSPMAELFDAGVPGFSDDGTAVKNSSILRSALEYSKMFNVPIIEHCEDTSISDGVMNEGINSTILGLPPIPSAAEDIIVMRDIIMAEYTGGKVHIAHISTKNSVEMVRQAKAKNINITAEVTPHHFTLTDESVKTYDTNFKMNPPLRTEKDIAAIIEGLKDGTIDCIASDHAPHSIEEKEVEFIYAPNGIIGLETSLGLALTELLHKNYLSLEQIILKYAINPRKILNIKIPEIKIGEPANLTVFNPDIVWTVDKTKFKSKSKNTPFDKKLLTGKSIAVINNKKMYFNDEILDL